jgi:hypothetical protein
MPLFEPRNSVRPLRSAEEAEEPSPVDWEEALDEDWGEDLEDPLLPVVDEPLLPDAGLEAVLDWDLVLTLQVPARFIWWRRWCCTVVSRCTMAL